MDAGRGMPDDEDELGELDDANNDRKCDQES